MNFKKVSENVPGRKTKGNPAKTSTKVQVDLLLHVLSEDSSNNKDVIPKPCLDGQVITIQLLPLVTPNVLTIKPDLHTLWILNTTYLTFYYFFSL